MQKSTWRCFPSFSSCILWRCTVPCLSFSSICLSISSCPLSSLLSNCLSSPPFISSSLVSLPSVCLFFPPSSHPFHISSFPLFHLYPVFPFLFSSLLVSLPYPYLSPLIHSTLHPFLSFLSLPFLHLSLPSLFQASSLFSSRFSPFHLSTLSSLFLSLFISSFPLIRQRFPPSFCHNSSRFSFLSPPSTTHQVVGVSGVEAPKKGVDGVEAQELVDHVCHEENLMLVLTDA